MVCHKTITHFSRSGNGEVRHVTRKPKRPLSLTTHKLFLDSDDCGCSRLSEWKENGGILYVWKDRYSSMKVLRVYYVKFSIRFKLHITKKAIQIHEFLILVYIEVSGNYSRKNGYRYPLIKRLNAPNRGCSNKEKFWAFRSPNPQPVTMLSELFKVTFF